MKLKSVLIATCFGLSEYFLLPFSFIYLSKYLGLPIYSNMKYLGYTVLTFGIILFLYCTRLFWFIGKGTPVPTDPPKKIVIKGFYKYTRNPIYISHTINLLGISLIFGNLLLFLLPLLNFIAIHLYVIFFEEPNLKKRFGKSYIDYCKSVPRWLF